MCTPWVTPCLLRPLIVLLSPLSTYLISKRMTNRSVNWHSPYQKWPLFFHFCQIWLTGTPNSLKLLLNRALGNTFMGPRLFLGANPNPQEIASSIRELTFYGTPEWATIEKWCFYMIFCLFWAKIGKPSPYSLRSLPAWKIVFLYVKLPPKPRWKSQPEYS